MSKITKDSLLDVANEMFYSVTKDGNFMLLELEGATGPDEAKY